MNKKEPKSYKKQDEASPSVNEEALEYHTSLSINETVYLPDEVLVGAIKYAQIARDNGRMIPHNEVYATIATKLRWR